MTSSGLAGDLAEIIGRELDRLREEIEAVSSDEDLWIVRGGQGNPRGTLALHLVGNLSHYVGAVLGNTGYVRDRPAEFSDRDVSRTEILSRISTCRDTVVPIVRGLSDATLDEPYPGDAPARMEGISTRGYLVHLVWHLGWHLGQAYSMRLGEQASV